MANLTDTSDPIFVIVVAFVTTTTESTNSILTSTVQTHAGKFRTFVDIFSFDESLSSGT